MPRRSNGEGCITRRPDGRWQASLQLDGKRKTIYGKTRTEVAEKLRALQGVARENGHLPDAGRQTVAEYLHQWLEQAECRLRPTTLQDYRNIAEKHVCPHVGNVRLSRLDPLRIARLYAVLAKAGLSSRRREMVHGFLHKVLADAHKWGLLPNNPASLVDPPKREHREKTLWTPEQVAAFLSSVQAGEQGQYGNLLGFLLASGCRIGEALGLRWSDIDFKAGTVRIERQIVQVGRDMIECEPKTKAGIRTITIPAWGMEMLRRQKARVAACRLKAGPGWQESARVFPSEVGTVPHRRNVERALHEACDRLNLPRIRVHDLRHLHLSMLAMAGVPVKVAQQRAGHATASVTMAVYSHVLGDADRQAAEALDKAVARI